MSVETARSPSGRYQLTIHELDRASRGVVTRISDGTVVCDLTRNDDRFLHTFVTKGDREYLIAGRSYMSQTIVELETGATYEPPGDQEDGSALIWVTCFLSPDGTTLAVDGCVWACPYELRFFDFTDPARGWPELRMELLEGPSDLRPPRWLDATTVEVHQRDRDGEPHERTRLERRGDEMVVVDHWVSDAEQARRVEAARLDAELDAWWATFRANDPMYLRLVELAGAFPGASFDGRPGARRIVQYFRRTEPKASADLHWDVDAATIRVQLYDAAGNCASQHAFAGTLDGIEAAVALVTAAFA